MLREINTVTNESRPAITPITPLIAPSTFASVFANALRPAFAMSSMLFVACALTNASATVFDGTVGRRTRILRDQFEVFGQVNRLLGGDVCVHVHADEYTLDGKLVPRPMMSYWLS